MLNQSIATAKTGANSKPIDLYDQGYRFVLFNLYGRYTLHTSAENAERMRDETGGEIIPLAFLINSADAANNRHFQPLRAA